MFLVNSRQGFFRCAPHHFDHDPSAAFRSVEHPNCLKRFRDYVQSGGGKPYRELTAACLPSSLTRTHPFALVYSTYPPVLVCGTVQRCIALDVFLGSALSGISRRLLQGIFPTLGSGLDPRPRICLRPILTSGTEIQSPAPNTALRRAIETSAECWNINQLIHRLRLSPWP